MGGLWSYFFPNPSPPPDPPPPLMETAWYDINWKQNQKIKKKLSTLHPKNQAVKRLQILGIGPVGAGKSSFVHSIDSILLNKKLNAATRVAVDDISATKTFTTYKFKDERGNGLPFVIGDVMGLESAEGSGVQTEDLVNVLNGHIKEGYTFNPAKACCEDDKRYNSSPSLNDRIHCLLFVAPANNFTASRHAKKNTLVDTDRINKMQNVRRKALELKIPLVVLLTKVDEACPHMKEDIKHIYRSQTIHQKVQACSKTLGIPMSDIFPVSNYHEMDEPGKNPDKDALLLHTLAQVLDYANDFVEKMRESEAAEDHRDMFPDANGCRRRIGSKEMDYSFTLAGRYGLQEEDRE